MRDEITQECMVAGEKLSCTELKKLQIKRRRNKVIDNEKPEDLIKLNVNYLLLRSKDQKDTDNLILNNPFAKIQSVNSDYGSQVDSIVENDQIILNSDNAFYFDDLNLKSNVKYVDSEILTALHKSRRLVTEKSLKTSIIFESNQPFLSLKSKLSDPIFLLRNMRDPKNDGISFYYRYPDVALPSNQRKNIHKALSNNIKTKSNEDENIIWYKMFSEKWRKALLSAFEALKHGFTDCFYFIQENLTIFFEKDTNDLTFKAYMQLSTIGLAEDLKQLEIEYKLISKSHQEPEIRLNTPQMEENDDYSENFEVPIKKPKVSFVKEDIIIEGSLALAELIDFIINQKDRNSYAILPEIYSPGPFIYGTLRSNSTTFSGPCIGPNDESVYHFKINGAVFPHSVNSTIQEFLAQGHMLSMAVEREKNTDFLAAYLH